MLLTIFIYISLFAFVFISLSKAIKFAKMPIHGRWELYPVPKEKGRSEYGGSYYEEIKWYEKPRETSLVGEIKEMLKEILFIKILFDNQRPLWWLSYSLHLGIYLLFVWTAMLFVGAGTELLGMTVDSAATGWAAFVYFATILFGVAGAILLAFGSFGLFLRRIFVDTLKRYSTPQDYFNLLFLFAVVATGLLVFAGDPGFQYGRDIAKGLLTFSPVEAGGMLTAHIILLGLVLIYIPSTKMSHYVGKYFTFHKVLWENDPNIPGSKVEQQVKEASSYKVKNRWAAPHIPGNTPPKGQ